MERELWTGVVAAVRAAAVGHRQRQRKFFDQMIVLTLLWAVLHDRPILWATNPCNWPFYMRIKFRPTASTMSRRLRSKSVLALLERVRDCLACTPEAGVALIIDAKPMPVGGYTTDRDARAGRACGCFAWGYKLYLIIDENSGVHAWKVESMNVAEQRVAEELIPAAARSAGASRWLLGDKAYDSNRLYAVAEASGLALLAPRIKAGAGFGPKQTDGRRRAIALLEPRATPEAANLMKRRDKIERYLGTLCASGGGLSPLPGYIRGLNRVRQWVGAKLLIHAVRCHFRALASD
jgi:hypothetical protein